MISHLGELDEEMYSSLRSGLIGRTSDKESLIRVYSIVALSKLVGTEDPDELDGDEQTILEILLDSLAHDPAAEVRRAAVINVPLTTETLEGLMNRTRDVDAVTRKLVYTTVLQTKLTHPRQLTISQREQVVKDGLGDREPGVRLAAAKLLETWLDAVAAEEVAGDIAWEGDDGGVMYSLVTFLQIFDVVGPGETIAVDALVSLFVTKPQILDAITFSAPYWQELTPETSVLARAFVDHCLKTNGENRLESSSLPVVTELAFHVQERYNRLLKVLQKIAETQALSQDDDEDPEKDDLEDDLVKAEVIMGELLRIAVNLDYSDEIGRRKTYAVVRDMLAHPQLPEGLIERSMDVLKVITPSERELIRVVVEIVIELRDQDDEADAAAVEAVLNDSRSEETQPSFSREKSLRREKPRNEMSPEEAYEADLIDLRCLLLCIAILERVDSNFEDNSTLEGVLADLIIPSVKRKELLLREKGLISLGLCCLIAKNMALSSFQLFLNQVQSAPDNLKLKVLQLVFDLLIMYEHEFFRRSPDVAERIITFLLHTLETEESGMIQTVLCIGISKLLLAGFVTDSRVLASLVLVYVSPATSDNPELRQCLSYFFPVYCYSSPANQSLMQSIFMTTYDLVKKVYEELDEDQEMISPQQFGLLMVDWTNPQKAEKVRAQAPGPLKDPHADLAVDILKELYDSERNGEDQKVLCQLLGQLTMLPGVDSRVLRKIQILADQLEERALLDNAMAQKTLVKFSARFAKQFTQELQDLDAAELDEDQEFRELYELIGGDARTAASKRRNGKHKPDRTATSDSDEESANASEPSAATPSTPPRPKQKRKTAAKRAPTEDTSEASDVASAPTDGPSPSTAQVTPMKKATKRLRSPSAKAALSSPDVRKKTRAAPGNTGKATASKPKTRRGKKAQDSDSEGSDALSPSPAPPKARPRRNAARPAPVIEGSEEDEEDQESASGGEQGDNDEAVMLPKSRSRASGRARKRPPSDIEDIDEEDESSD
ncbi:hypothetical protein HGRIS_011843 [Hohenbuehelia grisea]|uniref:Nuclear condensin complex subunit 3 C-terminal domain-containing protein n=1 Tax=Hohenbuehelia grisea TaxID=104357 RepID=A0ABR3JXR9_9AGAR